MNYTLRQGRVIDPANGLDQVVDVHMADGVVQALGVAPPGFTPDQVIDVQGRLVCPGLIDLWGRLQEPSLHDKSTIDSEVNAAIATGITTLCAPPDRTPITDSPALIEMIQRCSSENGKLNIFPIGALTKGLKGQQLSEMAALKTSGCRFISNARASIGNALILRRALEYAASHDLTVFLHAEEESLAAQGVMHEGAVSTRLGLPAIPDAAECIAVSRDLALVEQTGVKAHFCHLSSRKALALIQQAQDHGLDVSASVTISHLFLSDEDVVEFNSNCHLQPPLRTLEDQQGLRAGLRSGCIQAICSDHNPLPDDAKLAPFEATIPGASTMDAFLPLVLRLAEEGVLSLSQAIATITAQPARILGSNLGQLSVGSPANICVIDPAIDWCLAPERLLSKGLNSPFLDWSLKGRVTHTFFGGQLVYTRPVD